MKSRKNSLFAVLALAAIGAARCDTVYPPPPACRTIAPLVRAPSGVVWGFADLHAHPAIEVAFGGKLIWGTAMDPGPINAAELPAIAPCPVETHDPISSSPIDRNVGAQVFPELSRLCGFAHGPVGSIGFRPATAWPNARDIIHQEMNVSSIRRAYEGGLRLMIAATTDNQAISALLAGPNVDDGFVPNPKADYLSARAQLTLIQDMVEQNATWMRIAKSPREAREIIESGRLAIVLSLEMDGMDPADVEELDRDFGVRHMFPIHLVDNAVGGTAANGDLFNAASSVVSSIYRSDHAPIRYMDVAPTTAYPKTMGWPVAIGTLTPAPLYASLDPIHYASYAGLCYEPLGACAASQSESESFIEYGHENYRGLCSTVADCAIQPRPGMAIVKRYEDDKLLLDVSHMGTRSVVDTLLATADGSYPLMASHGDINHLCAESLDPDCRDSQRGPSGERQLEASLARQIVDRGGVLGLGIGTGAYDLQGLLAVRGGPVFTLDANATTACVARTHADGCVDVPLVDTVPPATPIDTLTIHTVGGIVAPKSFAQPFARVEMRAAVDKQHFQRHVFVQPVTCTPESCSITIPVGPKDEAVTNVADSACEDQSCVDAQACGADTYTVDDIQSVTLEWLYLACDGACHDDVGSGPVDDQCRTTWDDARAPSWTIDHVELDATSKQTGATTTTLATLGTTGLAVLGRERGSLVIWNRDDRPSAAPILTTGRLLKVTMRAGPAHLYGASPEEAGANVCVSVRQTVQGRCVSSAAPPAEGATECPAGWVTFNQRGEWDPGVELYTFVRPPSDDPVCGLDVSVLDWPKANVPFDVDEVRIEAIDDPVGHWVRRYAEVSRFVAKSRMGTVAFGTDANGLNGLLDISEYGVPAGAQDASACPVTTATTSEAPAALAPMRIRNADGSLGTEVRIEERGFSTYGMLADFLAIARTYPGCGQDVYDSLMLSAEAAIRMWEKAEGQTHADSLPVAKFACDYSAWKGPQ